MDERSVKRLAVILATAVVLILVFKSIGLKMATKVGQERQKALAARQVSTPSEPAPAAQPAPDSAPLPAAEPAPLPAPEAPPNSAPAAAPAQDAGAPGSAAGQLPAPSAPAAPAGI